MRYAWAENTKAEVMRQVRLCCAYLSSTNSLYLSLIAMSLSQCLSRLVPLTTHKHTNAQGCKDYDLRSYAGLGHSLSQEEIQHAMAFIAKLLPFNSDLAIPAKDPSDMSVKELKAAIANAGLQAQARGFCEKSEYVKLLLDHRAA